MAAFDDLGNDEAKNILSRLELELLVRSMHVSKRWKELIKEIVEKRQEKMKGLILVNFVSVLPGMYIPQYSYASQHADVHAMDLNDLYQYIPLNHFTIRDGCNGLLLCIGTAAAANEEEDHDEEPEPGPANYYVINPVTKKWVVVPDSPAAHPDQHDVLAYDPALSPLYKVLRWPRAAAQRQQDYADLDVYSSSSRTWSRRRVTHQRKNVTYPRALSSTFSVFIKGIVFRLADPNVVVDVDVSEDRIPPAKVINLPSQANEKPSTHRCLGKWRDDSGSDSLCYIDYNKRRINVWVQEDASRKRSPWVLKRVLSVEMLVRAIPRASRMENPFLPVTFLGEREEIVLELPEGVLCFNLRTSRVEGVYPIDYLRRRAYPFREVIVYPFSATFHSP